MGTPENKIFNAVKQKNKVSTNHCRFGIFIILCLFLPILSVAQEWNQDPSAKIITLGNTLLDSGKYKEAIKQFDRVGRNDTNYVKALYRKAISLEADSEFSNAAQTAEIGILEDSQRELLPNFYSVYGNSLDGLKQYDKALKIFNEGLGHFPNYALLYFYQSITLLHLGKNKEAEESLKKAIILSPYLYVAHYNLGIANIRQGNIIPSFLSLMGYLLLNPEGKYAAQAISLLDGISRGKDYILEYKKKRVEKPDNEYSELENIILSKIALDKEYKPIINLDDAISRQIQVSLEKLETRQGDTDFYREYYLPYFKKTYTEGSFELFINHIFAGVKIASIQAFNVKKKKEIAKWLEGASLYFDKIEYTRILSVDKRDTVKNLYHFSQDTLWGKGQFQDLEKKIKSGSWKYFFNNSGQLETEGTYNPAGKKIGEWRYYFFSGKLKAVENFENGKLEGTQYNYYENGNLKWEEHYKGNLESGFSTTYYFSGNKESEIHYYQGKKDGECRNYYSNGILKSITHYTQGIENGITQNFYKMGALKQNYLVKNGKIDGRYNSYSENGVLTSSGLDKEGKDEGEWRYYYENKGIKEIRNYQNGELEGVKKEYYENGHISDSSFVKGGKIDGEYFAFTQDGKIFSKGLYKNGILLSRAYYSSSGKEFARSDQNNGELNLISYNQEGIKIAHFHQNQKGNMEGVDSIFYGSGYLFQINTYLDGELNGKSKTYYQTGGLKYEVNMKEGKEDGHYTGYYLDGVKENEGQYTDGELQGNWFEYYANGKLSGVNYYEDGELSGYSEEFTPTGKKLMEGKYFHGWLIRYTQYDSLGKVIAQGSFPKLSGNFNLVYPNFAKKASGQYKYGQFIGDFNTYYINGTIEHRSHFKNGVLDSLYEQFTPEGQKNLVGYYALGVKTGTWNYFNSKGKVDYSRTFNPDNMHSQATDFSENGNKLYESELVGEEKEGKFRKYGSGGSLAYQIEYEKGKAKTYTYLKGKDLLPSIPISNNNGLMKSYYPNGQVSKLTHFLDGEQNGAGFVWYENGKPFTEDSCHIGLWEGIRKEYYENGNLKLQENYWHNLLIGNSREYYQNGKIKILGYYENGQKQGKWEYFDEKGKHTKTEIYYFDVLLSLKNEI